MADDTVMEDTSSQLLFDGLVFTIIPSTAFTLEYVLKLGQDIASHGGKLLHFDQEAGQEAGHIKDLTEITHIVSTTSDFPDYDAAINQFKHVVKPTWIDSCIIKNKLSNPRTFSPDPSLFMSDVTICCADIPEGDKEAIIGGVIAMGGQHSSALSKMVTHLVALTLDNDKCEVAVNKRLRCQIVLPHWFDDCLKLGRKIPEGPYTLPDPEILNVNAGPVGPSKTNRDIRDATTPAPQDIPTPLTSPSSKKSRTTQAFKGKQVMLSDDLKLGGHLKETIEELIRNSGGQITSNIEETDIYICHYRKGTGYVKASQAGKDVGNLSWLYHLITHNAWTSPLRRLLHYPVPSEGIPGFKEYKISLSNYTGEARVYLENLVKATGAEFTKTFRQDNTHLITAHMGSEKCEAAKEWNTNVVNHLWLEESYAKCALQTLTNRWYTHFPPRTNLGEVIGQTQIDREAVEKNYFKRETKPRKSKDIRVDNTAAKSSGIPASSFAAPRTTSNPGRATPVANKAKRIPSETSIQTPAANRRKDGKENETPSTTGSRGAKERAISKLHDLAPDVNQFQKEMKRSGGVIYGGKREKDAEGAKPMLKPSSRESSGSKRSFNEMDVDEPPTEEEAEEVTKESKKQKKEKKPPILYRMMLSKDDRWVDKQKKEAEDKNKLRELGIWIIEDPDRVNMLCAPKIVRTRKFVAALAAAPTLVATSYLDYVLKHNRLPPPEKYPLIDREFEKVHGFRIEESLERARQNNRRLLKNWVIFCTDGVNGGWETFRDIIEANGGSCQLYKGRASVTVSRRTINVVVDGEVSQNQEEDEPDVLYLMSEPKKDEVPLWKKFRDLAKTHNMVPRIVKTEWLLFVAMAQYVHWDEKWQLNEDVLESATKKK